MKVIHLVLTGLGAVALVLGIGIFTTYGSLVNLDESRGAKMGEVQIAEQNRYEGTGPLVATISASANFEKGTLTEITEARASVGKALQISASDLANNPELQKQLMDAQAAMSGALSKLIVSVEAYPDIKSTEAFITFMAQYEGMQNRVTQARRQVQEVTRDYNQTRRTPIFGPLARMFGDFPEREYYEQAPGTNVPPPVDFNIN